MKRAIIVLVVVAAIGAGVGTYYFRRGGPEIAVNTAPVTRGDIVDTVGSTGTLQAVTTVQVGSQVSGNIMELGADFNSIVKKGQVIAKLDPSLFQAQLEQSKANLNQSKANLAKAQSDLERMKVQLLDAQQKYNAVEGARGPEPRAPVRPRRREDRRRLRASQPAVAAGHGDADGGGDRAVASLGQQNQVNLDHSIITAPIDGIVTQRSVDVGQTVAASMQAPTLFIIAADLTKMQVSANIDESDVGRIRPGQRVTFRVDAYPTEQFEGTVIADSPAAGRAVERHDLRHDHQRAERRIEAEARHDGEPARSRCRARPTRSACRTRPSASGRRRTCSRRSTSRFRPRRNLVAAAAAAVEAAGGAGGGGNRANGGNGGNRPNAAAQNAQAAGECHPRGRSPADTWRRRPGRASSRSRARPTTTAAARGNRRGRGGQGADGAAGGSRAGAVGDGSAAGGGQARRRWHGRRRRWLRRRGGGRGQALERFKAMTPDQQQQFIARMKDRGQDISAVRSGDGQAGRGGRGGAGRGGQQQAGVQPKYGDAPTARNDRRAVRAAAAGRDAGPRVAVSRQAAEAGQRAPRHHRRHDHGAPEQDALQPGTEVVTTITGVGAARPAANAQGTGNPFSAEPARAAAASRRVRRAAAGGGGRGR